MPASDAFVTAFDAVPFVFGCVGAEALPGPILTGLISELGMTTSAAKALLHRMTQVECLSLERHGRVGVYRMAGDFRAHFEAFRDDDWERPPWDGRFHTLVYDIGEDERRVRDRLRAAAIRAGYRQLRSGVLIGPREASAGLEPFARGHRVTGGWWEIDPEQVESIVRACWGLDEIRARYDEALTETRQLLTTDLESLSGRDAFRIMHATIRPLVELSLLDGQLPQELLPNDWPATDLQAGVGQIGDRLWAAVGQHVSTVVDASPHAGLVERGEPRDVSAPRTISEQPAR